MNREYGTYYKKCRENAGYTQEQAAELLDISIHTLSNYEADKEKRFTVPSDEMVDCMATVYDTPLLAMWHLQTHNPLGRYFPEVQPLQSTNDMGFQTMLTANDFAKAEELFCKIMADGRITPDEEEDFARYCTIMDRGAERAFTINFHIKHVGTAEICTQNEMSHDRGKEAGAVGQQWTARYARRDRGA